MIRRADIEGSKSTVAKGRSGATSQFFGTVLIRAFPLRLWTLAIKSRRIRSPSNLSIGNRLFLNLFLETKPFQSLKRVAEALSFADYPYLWNYNQSFSKLLTQRFCLWTLGIHCITGFSSIQVCRTIFVFRRTNRTSSWGEDEHHLNYWDSSLSIPVVTFLTPQI